jgi:hypothetical protein
LAEPVASSEIQRKLQHLRERWHRIHIAEGGLVLSAWLLGTILAFTMIEGWAHTPQAIRWVMVLGLLVLLVGGLVILVFRRLLASRSDEELALLAERAFPDVQNGLINAVRLAKDSDAPSPDLVDAAIREAASRVAPVDLTSAVSTKRLRRYAIVTAVFGATILIGLAVFPSRMQNAFARIAFPGRPIPKIGRVIIKEMTPAGDSTLVSGDSLKVAAIIEPAGGHEIAGTFIYAFEGGTAKSVKMQSDERGDLFRAELRDVRVPLSFHLEIGGTESARLNVTIVEKPTVNEVWRRYDFPAYTGLESKEESDAEGAIRVVAGTGVQMKVRTNKPVEQAFLRREDGNDTPFMLETGNMLLTLPSPFRVLKDGAYTIHLSDKAKNENTGRATHTIHALPDKAPEVSIAAPGKDMSLAPGASLDLLARGVDDYGIAGAQLVAWREGGQDTEMLKEWTDLRGKNVSLQWQWMLDPQKYKKGDIFRYRVKMWDNNNVTGPGTGVSSEYQLRIEDPSAVQRETEEKYQSWRTELQDVLDRLRDLRQDSSKLGGVREEEQ